MWYEQEEGDSWFRQGNYGKALKKYIWIEKVPKQLFFIDFEIQVVKYFKGKRNN
jgi:hypothetical protein